MKWFDVYLYQNFDDEFHKRLDEIKENLPCGEYSEEIFIQAVDSKIQELSDKLWN